MLGECSSANAKAAMAIAVGNSHSSMSERRMAAVISVALV